MKIKKIIVAMSLLTSSSMTFAQDSAVSLTWYSSALGNGLKINSTFSCASDTTMIERHVITGNAISPNFWANATANTWLFRFHTGGGSEIDDAFSVPASNFHNALYELREGGVLEYQMERPYEVLTHRAERTLSYPYWLISNLAIDPGCDSLNVLTKGVAVTGLSGTTGDEKYYIMNVPAGATNLSFSIQAPAPSSGDADIYVKKGSDPTLTNFDCRPYYGGSNETCNFAVPEPGVYHIMVRAYTSYNGIDLLGTYTP